VRIHGIATGHDESTFDNRERTPTVKNATLEAQRVALAQRKAKLDEQLRKLAERERRARTRNLIECGGLIVKAGLADLPANALYGALLTLKAASADPLQVKRWAADGSGF
jgi:hypothetical protein